MVRVKLYIYGYGVINRGCTAVFTEKILFSLRNLQFFYYLCTQNQ